MNVGICHYQKISGVSPKLLVKTSPNGLMILVKPLHWNDYYVIT